MYFGNNANGLEAKFNTPENQSSKVKPTMEILVEDLDDKESGNEILQASEETKDLFELRDNDLTVNVKVSELDEDKHFNIDDISWQQEMDLIDKFIETKAAESEEIVQIFGRGATFICRFGGVCVCLP